MGRHRQLRRWRQERILQMPFRGIDIEALREESVAISQSNLGDSKSSDQLNEVASRLMRLDDVSGVGNGPAGELVVYLRRPGREHYISELAGDIRVQFQHSGEIRAL